MSLLRIPRSSYYYRHKCNAGAFWESRVEDEILDIYLDTPFYGVRRVTEALRRRNMPVNHKRVARLRRRMGLNTICPRPRFNTSEPSPAHEKYPYLLRGMEITRPNQVWSTDITYTSVGGHRAYVIGILDWYSRKVLSYSVVNTMDAYSCIETLNLALERFGQPEIFNSDQGSQFTSAEFLGVLRERRIQISMDGRGRCRDNARMERFWWSLKYEDIKIRDYVSLPQLRRGVQSYVNFYNGVRPHQALHYKTPDSVYFTGKE